MRRVQRYGSTGAERRRPKGKNLADLRRRGTVNLAGPQLAKAREAGLGVRVTMVYRISQTTYTKDLPGGAKWQRLGPRDIRSALGLWAAGDVEGAGAELESLFNEKYWVMRPDASGKMVSNIAGGDVQLDGEDEDGTPLGVTYAWVMIGHP
jgi:hypothetical protein